ncbi:hypothetical protein [Lysobacter sp. CA199]|uniref:hypothetical protein n=1 Tax=Lysobacter sp. CA199 TaxID=3455608 RepID=UPI003F8D7E9E
MRYRSWTIALLLAGACVGIQARAETVVTELQSKAETYPGHEYRDASGRAIDYFREGRKDAAWNVLQPAIVYCDERKSDERMRYYSVADKTEEEEFRSETPAGTSLVFVDMACPHAYKSAAFLAVESKEYERAFALLDRAQAIAPHWPQPLAERGYLVGQLGDNRRALELYRHALALVEKYPRSGHLKGLVLRGIGYQLIETGDLEGAQRAYRDSLKAEPDNALAQRELEFIRGQREATASGK